MHGVLPYGEKTMIKEIVHDPVFLSLKAKDATAEDVSAAQDLLDTLAANSERCVGMAANMIGVCRRIICFNDGGVYSVMFNPEIISGKDVFEAEEGCLSLSGVRRTKRYKKIKVRYQNEKMQVRLKTYTDFTAQIIQHEIDHCSGILI